MRAMRHLSAALVVALVPLAARADVEDLSGSEVRRARRPPTFALRGEAGSDFAPYGRGGACISFFNENPIGGNTIEVGAGAGFPGVQFGLALRQLVGDGGEYFAFEIAIAGNSVRNLGYDPASGHLQSSHYFSSLGVGYEHRAGFLDVSVIAALAFTTSLDLVPHGVVHGGVGFAF
jgi:hypothetical protein